MTEPFKETTAMWLRYFDRHKPGGSQDMPRDERDDADQMRHVLRYVYENSPAAFEIICKREHLNPDRLRTLLHVRGLHQRLRRAA